MQGKIFTILFLITLVFLLNSVSYTVSFVVTPLSGYAITERGTALIASNSAGKLYVIVPSRGRIAGMASFSVLSKGFHTKYLFGLV